MKETRCCTLLLFCGQPACLTTCRAEVATVQEGASVADPADGVYLGSAQG